MFFLTISLVSPQIDGYRCVHPDELLSVAYGDSGERTDSLKPEMTVTQYCFFLLIWLQKKDI